MESSATKEEILELFEWIIDESVVEVESFQSNAERWHIVFKPYRSLFLSGNDPAKILANLQSICSDFQLTPLLDEVPTLSLLDPESCFLGWEIRCSTELGYEKIKEVFEWVDDHAGVQILALDEAAELPVDNSETSPTDEDKSFKSEVGDGKETPVRSTMRLRARKKLKPQKPPPFVWVSIKLTTSLIW